MLTLVDFADAIFQGAAPRSNGREASAAQKSGANGRIVSRGSLLAGYRAFDLYN